MLANFLNKSKPINFISLLLLFLVAFLFVVFVDGYSQDTLFKSGILLILFLVIFFLFNFINSKNGLTLDNSYAYFSFVLLTICISSELLNYTTLVEVIIYFFFLRKIYSLRSSKKLLEKFFDSGFWLGILFILQPFSVLFFILIYIAIYSHNKITIHSLFIPIIGFISPLIVYFTYFFWYDNIDKFLNLFNFNIHFDIQFYNGTKYFWLINGVLVFSILAIFFKSIKALAVKNTFRKSWIVLLSNFIVALLFLIAIPVKNGSELVFMLFPTAIILANGIELIPKKIFKNVVLYLFLAVAIVSLFIL